MGSREDDSAECALLPSAEVQKRLASELVPATTALGEAALDAHLVREESRTFGRGQLASTIAARTFSVAALVGWADPRVARRKQWGERMLVHHGKRVLELLAAKSADDTIVGFGRFASAQIEAPCSKKALAVAFVDTSDIHRPTEGCAFRASLTRDPDGHDLVSNTFFHHVEPSLEADVVLADGEVVLSTVTALEGKLKSNPDVMSTVTLPKGESGAAHFLVPTLEGKAAPHALVIRAEKKWIAVPYAESKKAPPKRH